MFGLRQQGWPGWIVGLSEQARSANWLQQGGRNNELRLQEKKGEEIWVKSAERHTHTKHVYTACYGSGRSSVPAPVFDDGILQLLLMGKTPLAKVWPLTQDIAAVRHSL